MPDYRKKRRNRIFSSPSRPKTATKAKSGGEDIKMTPDGGKRAVKPKAESNMKALGGTYLEERIAEPKKCNDYCICKDFCPFYKGLNK